MKKRTLVTAWVFIAVSTLALCNIKSANPATVGMFRFGIHLTPEALLLVDNIVINTVLIVGWVNLLKKRTWAWWTLVVAYALMAGRMVGISLTPPEIRYIAQQPILYAGFYLTGFLLFAILPLLVLLTDKPSAWKKEEAGKLSLNVGALKSRTRVGGYMLLVISAGMFVFGLSLFPIAVWEVGLVFLAMGVFWPFWIFLLKEKAWAWTILVILTFPRKSGHRV